MVHTWPLAEICIVLLVERSPVHSSKSSVWETMVCNNWSEDGGGGGSVC